MVGCNIISTMRRWMESNTRHQTVIIICTWRKIPFHYHSKQQTILCTFSALMYLRNHERDDVYIECKTESYSRSAFSWDLWLKTEKSNDLLNVVPITFFFSLSLTWAPRFPFTRRGMSVCDHLELAQGSTWERSAEKLTVFSLLWINWRMFQARSLWLKTK